ncbi:hypothetical protein LSTR_LSTR007932 [Laodelphax striatellus]|uniref:Cep192/Spd-2-like domain-containing protein n=1 Tax=Laodelphax striatellus TaxID=195883 RepID=A0A482XS99_LAOST|nr:hypothetical protein LSTR_LSTR007932 [Laodelphax striatellus]
MDPENTPPSSSSKQKAELKFLEDSLIRTPDPQACSTVNRPKDVIDLTEPDKNERLVERTEPEEPKFLVDERNTIDSLHKKLNQMFEKIKRDSIHSNAPALSEVNSSLGILKIDDIGVGVDRNISSASSYLRSKSEPIGSLGGDKDKHQRPYFGMQVFSPVKSLDDTGCIADVLPKECSINQSTADLGHDLSVSSIASITQIKEMLGEMGQNSPTLIINKLMNAEGRKKTKQANRLDTLKRSENAHHMRKENLTTIDLTADDSLPLKPYSSPQRGVLQDMTNLQQSPVKVIDVDTNSTILDPKVHQTDAERSRTNDREISFSNLEISSDSFMVGPLSRSTSIEDIGKAINASNCNSSLMDDADDDIKLRYCIGSICNVMITLSNSSPTNNVHCSISLIEVMKNKQLSPKAAKIIFPPEVTLTPGETKKIEIQLIPFAIGLLDIALQVDEVEENSGELRSFLCTVTLKSEKPRLLITKVPEDEFVNNNQIDFGLLPEESQRKSVISIENVGNVKVPLNITVSEDSSKFQVFHLQETDKSEVFEKLVILDPGERLEESVYCFTPPLEHNNVTKTSQKITGELCVSLASIVRETTKFARYQLSATVGYTRVLISPNCNPLVVPAYEKRQLLIRNASILPLTLNLLVEDAEFRLESDLICLEPNQDGTIMVEFAPVQFKSNLKKSARLWLCIDSTETRYEVKIIGQSSAINDCLISSSTTASDSVARPKSVASVMTSSSRSPHASKTCTPYTSRSSSPCGSNLSSEKGTLDLASTQSALVWASCPLQIAERRGCVIRNKNNYKEKLLLTIADNSGCYKLVEEKGNAVQEMRINLEGMESRQITVSYCPLQVGASKASLVITRANQKSTCGQPNRKV